MSKAKDLLAKLKTLVNSKFDDMPPAAPAPAPAAPPAGVIYILQDGTTQISIVQAGDTPAVGDVVTVNGALAPANTYTLQDGSTLTTDATGVITAYTAAQPVTVDPVEAAKPAAPAAPAAPTPAPAPPAKFEMTPDGAASVLAAFAIGSPDERIANLELVCKALMEYNFGWQIREAQQKATTELAIEVYKQDLITAQAALAKQDKVIGFQDDKLKAMLELMSQIVEAPTADPVTVPEARKSKFAKDKSAGDQVDRYAKHIKSFKESGQPA